MLKQDKKQFAELMRATLGIYDKEITAETLVLWWNALQAHSVEEVREALSRHVQDRDRGRFAPKPADVLAVIDAMKPDGRMGAEEAWATYPHNESDSAVITDEIAEAMSIAKPLLDEGDKIGARMAFKEAYARIVATNKASGVKPKWFPSLGQSKEGRQEALEKAVRMGRISQDHAQSLLPAPKNSALEAVMPQLKMLTANEKLSEEDRLKSKAKMAEIKAMLMGRQA